MRKIKADRVAIVGSRGFKALDDVINYVKGLPNNCTIVSGGAKGVDKTAEDTAISLGMEVKIHRPKKFGAAALMARNQDIVDDSDFVVAFWDGKSNGTIDTIRKAYRINKEVFVFIYPWNDKAMNRVKAVQKSGKQWWERVQTKLK